MWFPTEMLEENGGHGGSRCRWSEKSSEIFLCDRGLSELSYCLGHGSRGRRAAKGAIGAIRGGGGPGGPMTPWAR